MGRAHQAHSSPRRGAARVSTGKREHTRGPCTRSPLGTERKDILTPAPGEARGHAGPGDRREDGSLPGGQTPERPFLRGRGQGCGRAVWARQGQGGLEEGQGAAAAQPPGPGVTAHSSERRGCEGPGDRAGAFGSASPVGAGAAFVLEALGSRWGLPGPEDGPADLAPWEGAAGPAKAGEPGAELLLRGAWEPLPGRSRGC